LRMILMTSPALREWVCLTRSFATPTQVFAVYALHIAAVYG
jgi:hypothetical protein